MCCTRLAGNTGCNKSPFWHPCTTLSRYIFGTTSKACIDNQKKNLLNSNTFSTCPDNMVNIGLLTAEICWRVWGTPANFNGFCVLAALLHGTLVVGISQTAALNRGRHLHSAEQPSHSALVHISSKWSFFLCDNNLLIWQCSYQTDTHLRPEQWIYQEDSLLSPLTAQLLLILLPFIAMKQDNVSASTLS